VRVVFTTRARVDLIAGELEKLNDRFDIAAQDLVAFGALALVEFEEPLAVVERERRFRELVVDVSRDLIDLGRSS